VHRLSSSFVLAYHGCQRPVGERLLAGEAFEQSTNDYDWLGTGTYFWETNPRRALEWAAFLKAKSKPTVNSDPFVVGAVIDLGYCLDLLSSNGIAAVKAAHSDFKEQIETFGNPMPRNSGGVDLLSRRLDCAAINHLHTIQARASAPAFDSVRGVFIEGPEIYENSGFREKTHIQICVRNPLIIKGVFRVSPAELPQ
jgi:hypothetical protein